MKRFVLVIAGLIFFVFFSTSVFGQVKLYDSGVTKFYPKGNRITYFQMSGFPNTVEMREYVTKSVLQNPDIDRVVIYTDGKTFMYDALQSIEPDMVVDAINDALSEYKSADKEVEPDLQGDKNIGTGSSTKSPTKKSRTNK